MSQPLLLPQPRQVTLIGGDITLPEFARIVIPGGKQLFCAQWIQSALHDKGLSWSIVTYRATDDFALILQFDETLPAQGYQLVIDDTHISIKASDDSGLFYGLCTLKQLLSQTDTTLLKLIITDHPDFAARGIMLDISRDKVPTLPTLMQFVDEMASLKINQLQLYIEHTFAYQNHDIVWNLASPLTAEDILVLDAYCKERFVDLVPNQNSLGHMERWLKHPEYAHLAEKPDGFIPPWGGPWRSPSTVDPSNPQTLHLFQELYDELLPNFSSRLFNVGCDEPWELGQGKNKEAVEQQGGRLYLSWLKKLHAEVTRRGSQMMFWGDIIIHYPDLVPELPDDVIAMEWGYEATHKFDEHCALFAEASIPFYVCPGTSSWNSLIGRSDNALANLRHAAENGLKFGAIGYLNTDWGDNGHMQPLSTAYLGFAYGAAMSWNTEQNSGIDIAAVLDKFIFRDDACVMGEILTELGLVYRDFEWQDFNGHLLAYIIQVPYIREKYKNNTELLDQLPSEKLHKVIDRLELLLTRLPLQQMQRTDADLIVAEIKQAAHLIQHAAKWLLYLRDDSELSAQQLTNELDGLVAQQRENWLARNQRGGLEDSLRRLSSLRQDYQANELKQ